MRARTTITLGALKIGLLLEPARAFVGTLYVGDIGIEDEIEAVAGANFAALDDAEFCAFSRRARRRPISALPGRRSSSPGPRSSPEPPCCARAARLARVPAT